MPSHPSGGYLVRPDDLQRIQPRGILRDDGILTDHSSYDQRARDEAEGMEDIFRLCDRCHTQRICRKFKGNSWGRYLCDDCVEDHRQLTIKAIRRKVARDPVLQHRYPQYTTDDQWWELMDAMDMGTSRHE